MLLVQPAADTPTLECIEQSLRERLVFMAVADETREELDSLIQE